MAPRTFLIHLDDLPRFTANGARTQEQDNSRGKKPEVRGACATLNLSVLERSDSTYMWASPSYPMVS
jgi:hypothetical protein